MRATRTNTLHTIWLYASQSTQARKNHFGCELKRIIICLVERFFFFFFFLRETEYWILYSIRLKPFAYPKKISISVLKSRFVCKRVFTCMCMRSTFLECGKFGQQAYDMDGWAKWNVLTDSVCVRMPWRKWMHEFSLDFHFFVFIFIPLHSFVSMLLCMYLYMCNAYLTLDRGATVQCACVLDSQRNLIFLKRTAVIWSDVIVCLPFSILIH